MTAAFLRNLFQLHDLQQGAGKLPAGILNDFLPGVQDGGTAVNSLTMAVCTPKDTTFVINAPADAFSNPTVDDVADADLNYTFGQGDGIGNIRGLLAFVRRKPGTTGAIIAQSVTIRKNDGSGTVLGGFTSAAAVASADPSSGLVWQEWPTATVTGITALHVTCTGADTDVEIVLIAFGEN